MAKLTHEQAVDATAAAKLVRSTAKTVVEAFEKENKLKPMSDHKDDSKHGKAWLKLKNAHRAGQKLVKEAEEAEKALKPAKIRVTTYEYPADIITTGDKKKYRATQRAAKAKAAKGDTPKVEKASKAEKPTKAAKATPAEPATEAPVKKKKKVSQAED